MKNIPPKKRVIVDYKNITPELMQILSNEYPYGFEDDTIHFTNAKGERVEAVPIESEDAKYLVKMSTQLVTKFEAFQDDEENNEHAETDTVFESGFEDD